MVSWGSSGADSAPSLREAFIPAVGTGIFPCGARETTNNKMELQAVISALRVVNRPVPIVIHTDSSYVKDGITKWIHAWKRNRWLTAAKKPVKNVELWQALDDLVSRHEITWVWVKGHDGDPGNEKADELANRGVEVARGKLEAPALARC